MRDVPRNREKAKITSIFKTGELEMWRTPGYTASPQSLESCWEKIFLKHIFKYMKEKRFIESSQHVFMRGKPSLMAFTMRSLARQIKWGEQLMFLNLIPVKSLYLCHHRQADEVRVRKVDNDMD